MTAGVVVLAVVLLLANGLFVAVEFALIASRRTKLETLAAAGSVRARWALGATHELSLQLAGVQLGITMASLGLGAVAEPAVADLLERGIEVFGEVPEGVLHGVSFTVALAIVVFLHMVIGEMAPKNIAIAGPERTLLWLAGFTRAYMALFRPVIRLLNGLANAGVRLLGVEPRDELFTTHTADELARMLAASQEEGLIEEMAHDLLSGALDFGRRPVQAVMRPRDQVVAVGRQASVAEVERVANESGYSRVLVVGADLDDVVGFVHVKDLLNAPVALRDQPLPHRRIRRLLIVGSEQPLDAVLLAMRRTRTHVAAVRGPTGALLGIATLEDVLERLVGDIRDESDRPRRANRRS